MGFEPLRLRKIDADELLSEEDVLCVSYHPFLGPGDRPEPYRSYYIFHTRLGTVFQKERVWPQLLVDIAGMGRALLVRVWRSQLDVLLLQGNVLDERVTVIKAAEYSFFVDEESEQKKKMVTLVLDTLVLNPPKLS